MNWKLSGDIQQQTCASARSNSTSKVSFENKWNPNYKPVSGNKHEDKTSTERSSSVDRIVNDAYNDIFQRWMNERKAQEKNNKEYNHKMKLTLAAMKLLELYFDKKCADSEVMEQNLASAKKKVFKLEAELKSVSKRAQWHEKLYTNEKTQSREDRVMILNLRDKLMSTVAALKYIKKEAKNKDVKLNEAEKRIHALRKELLDTKQAQTFREREFKQEITIREKLQENLTLVTDELMTLRRKDQKLHQIEDFGKIGVVKHNYSE